jgi:hypothetical protein
MKVGDIVKHKQPGNRLRGIILKVYGTGKGEEYRVEWFKNHGRSRCTRGILEIVSEAR